MANTIPEPRLIIVSAPSGAGKTTIVRHLLSLPFNLAFSVSATTRGIRPGEVNHKDYHFISPDAFKRAVQNNELLEWEEVYPDKFYGTLKREVDQMLQNGSNVIFDVDVVGGLNIKKHYGQRALSVFVSPPSVEALGERLRIRNTDSNETIIKRLEKAAWEMEFASRFDYVLVNDDLEKAKQQITEKVKEFLQQT